MVQDAQAYQRMIDALERAEATEGIRRGLASMERGEGRPAEEVFEEMRGKHGVPRDDEHARGHLGSREPE